MARRERTTAIPRARSRYEAPSSGKFRWTDGHTRLGILSVAVVLLLVVVVAVLR